MPPLSCRNPRYPRRLALCIIPFLCLHIAAAQNTTSNTTLQTADEDLPSAPAPAIAAATTTYTAQPIPDAPSSSTGTTSSQGTWFGGWQPQASGPSFNGGPEGQADPHRQDGGPHGDHPGPPGQRRTDNSVDWSNFLRGVSRIGLGMAGSRLNSGGGMSSPFSNTGTSMMGSTGLGGQSLDQGSNDGLSRMTGGGGAMAGGNGMMRSGGSMMGGGMSGGGGMAGGRGMMGGGGINGFAIGSNLLRSLASSTGGTLGSSLNTITRFADMPLTGLSLPVKSRSGIDFQLSGSLGSLIPGINQGMGGGSGAGRGPGGGAGGGMGTPGGRGGSGGQGPSLSLHMKF